MSLTIAGVEADVKGYSSGALDYILTLRPEQVHDYVNLKVVAHAGHLRTSSRAELLSLVIARINETCAIYHIPRPGVQLFPAAKIVSVVDSLLQQK